MSATPPRELRDLVLDAMRQELLSKDWSAVTLSKPDLLQIITTDSGPIITHFRSG